jgi:hypothetical protein
MFQPGFPWVWQSLLGRAHSGLLGNIYDGHSHPTSNNSMELTASRRNAQFQMIKTINPAATLDPARSSSSWSR